MKNTYQKVLVALDVYAEQQAVLNKALALAGSSSKLYLVYVTVPLVNFQPYGMAYDSDFFNEALQRSKELLADIAQKHNIPQQQAHCPVGTPPDEIHRLAEEVDADLIVIGTHGQSGLQLLLGSTANGVLHGVKCDVLAVKI